jgi:hypothetical protein
VDFVDLSCCFIFSMGSGKNAQESLAIKDLIAGNGRPVKSGCDWNDWQSSSEIRNYFEWRESREAAGRFGRLTYG